MAVGDLVEKGGVWVLRTGAGLVEEQLRCRIDEKQDAKYVI